MWLDLPLGLTLHKPMTLEVSVVGQVVCGLQGILSGESHHRPISQEQGLATCSRDIHTFESGSWFGPGAW